MKSLRFSFKGYNPLIALANNKDIVKYIVSILSGVTVATNFDWKVFFWSLLAAVGVLCAKMVADAIDFYFTEVEVPNKVVSTP